MGSLIQNNDGRQQSQHHPSLPELAFAFHLDRRDSHSTRAAVHGCLLALIGMTVVGEWSHAAINSDSGSAAR
jgi:hypothetical protein